MSEHKLAFIGNQIKLCHSKPSYKEKEATVSVSDGKRSDLNVELEKV
jgi:hypothetical protein